MAIDPLLQLLVNERRIDAERAAVVAAHAEREHLGVDTSLLALGIVDEPTLLSLLPRAWGGGVADRARLAGATTAARVALPRATAEEHRFVPLDISGRKLTVACCVPDDLTAFEMALDEVGFALSLYLRPLWTTEPLNARELHRLYGTPVPQRLRALVDGDDGAAAVVVPTSSPRSTTGFAMALADDVPGFSAVAEAALPSRGAAYDVVDEGDLAVVVVDEGDLAASTASPLADVAWSAPVATRFDAARVPTPSAAVVFPALTPDPSGWMIAPRGAFVFDAGPEPSAPVLSLVVDGTVVGPRSDARNVMQSAAPAPTSAAVDAAARQRRRTKVLWNIEDAAAEVALARTRDELLDVACRFAWRRLHSAAVVVRQADRLIVWDILDPNHDGDALRGFPLSMTGDHALARAFALAGPSVGPVDGDDPLCRLLGRTPHALLVVPVAVGGRVAAAVIGDNGERSVPATIVAELQRLAPRLGAALAALIVRQKRSASTLPVSVSVSVSVASTSTVPAPPSASSRVASPVDAAGAAAVVDDLDELRFTFDDGPLLPTRAPLAPPELAGRDVPPDIVVGALVSSPSMLPASASDRVVDQLPGAYAKEAVLLATWRRWIDAECDEFDADVSLLSTSDDSNDAAAAARRLVEAASLALPALARAFPGRASSVSSALVGRPVPLAQLPPPRPSSVPGVLVTLGADAAAAIVVGALDQSARELRFAAVHLLAHVDVPAALPRLAVRVFDHEPRIARLALEVLSRRRTTPGFTDVLARLRELARRGDGDDRLPAIAALAALRDPQAVGILVDLLSTRPTQIAEAAHDALVRITRADFGFAERRWRAWASVHADEPRRRWLLRALRHVDVSLRRAAAADLVDDGVPLFGYDADADVLDRDISVDAIARNLGEPVP